MKNLLTIGFKTLLLATFAVWFGGFFFYVSFVIPIGTELLGSARNQGIITQQVTHKLNLVCAMAVFMMFCESFRTWKMGIAKGRWVQLAMPVLICGMLVALVALHPYLDELIDSQKSRVLNKSKFYGLHRVYLWLSTLQWIAAWPWLLVTIGRWQRTTSDIS